MFQSLNSWATTIAGQMLLLAQAAPAAAEGQQPPEILKWLPMVAIAVLGYFLLIRPQAQQAAKLREQISELKSGDKVVTKSGIYGTVMNVDLQKNRLTLKIDEANNTKIDVVLNTIDHVVDDKVKETA